MTRFVGRWSLINKQDSPHEVSELVPVQYSRPFTANRTTRTQFYRGAPAHGSLHHRIDTHVTSVWNDDQSGRGYGPPVGPKWSELRTSEYHGRLSYQSVTIPNGAMTWINMALTGRDGFTTSGITGTIVRPGFWLLAAQFQVLTGSYPGFASRAFISITAGDQEYRCGFNGDNYQSFSVMPELTAGATFRVGYYQSTGSSMTIMGTFHANFMGRLVGSSEV